MRRSGARNRAGGPEADHGETCRNELLGLARDADDAEIPPLPRANYDDSLTSPEACIRLWISAVLVDKERGDKLTPGDEQILSLIGLEPSWVQRMIDRVPYGAKALRKRFI